MVQIVNARAALISVGLIQTLIGTAMWTLTWVDRVLGPAVYAAAGLKPRPDTPGDYLSDWLCVGSHSIFAGAAYVRRQYNEKGTCFDLPVVTAAYNAGSPITTPGDWGLRYFGNYMGRAGPYFNAAVSLFNSNPDLQPLPKVRFRI